MKKYPKPDFKLFLKAVTSMSAFLVFLHWVPALAAWIYAHFYGELLIIDMQRFHRVLVVAYVMAGITVIVNLAALLWSIWHNREHKA